MTEEQEPPTKRRRRRTAAPPGPPPASLGGWLLFFSHLDVSVLSGLLVPSRVGEAFIPAHQWNVPGVHARGANG